VCDEFGDKVLLGEVSGNKSIIRKFLGDDVNDGLGLIFDFEMLNFQFTAEYFHKLIRNIETHFPDPFMPVYVFSNHDRRRSIHKLGNDLRKAKLLAMLQLTVRGVPCMYYGEEIGMTDLPQPFGSAYDPVPHKFKYIPRFLFDLLGLTINRDEVRTPMQWDGSKNAGFSSAEKTWLPIHENHSGINVTSEKQEEYSLLNVIQAIMEIRNMESALQKGTLHLIEGLPDGVLGYERRSEDKKLAVLLNFTENHKKFQFENSGMLFQLSSKDEVKNQNIQLADFGAMIIKLAG
jgi:alpha-glucosidase